MSTIFKGSHWRSRAFSSSHFGGAAPVTGEPGESHWLGSHWKNSQFATAHFRGIVAPLAGEGLHWKNSQFKCSQFATRHFRGITVPVSPPPPTHAAESFGGTGRVIGIKRIYPSVQQPQRIPAALAAALYDETDLL